MRIFGQLIGLSLIILFSSACSKSEVGTFKIENIKISAEGPLFEGSNTAQAEIIEQLKKYVVEHKLDINNIETAKLKSLHILSGDTAMMNRYSSISIQLASEKIAMISIGVINPVPVGSSELALSIAVEQDNLLDLLKQDKVILVADITLVKDSDAGIELSCNMEFEITYKK